MFIRSLLCISVALATVQFATSQIDVKTTVDALAKAPAVKVDSIPWKWKTDWGLGFSTIQLNNWTGGGQDAVTIRLLFLGSLDYANPEFSWDNDLELGYSLLKQGAQTFRKADDRIYFSTRASLKQTDNFRYTAFAEFRTQFYVGSNYDVIDTTTNDYVKISNFMAPAYLTGALGAEYVPVPELQLLAAPISTRSTFVGDDGIINAGIASGLGAYGLAPGVRSRTDLGAVINLALDWEVFENIRWKTRFNGFMPYQTPDLWVLTFENAFLLKVNSWLNVTWLTDVFYNDQVPVVRDNGTVGPATQLRNQLVIAINYSIANF
ncbi:MAG: DUF3078 domain-containing protein [Candidatus Kapabacteria bacterium]|nr:DUF3078 domain-containing protein [Candidatus Kapabacteria bacterium]